ncbi:MAG TPA: amidase [Acidimicrobiales bacterium]|nr:amidase [Acidimicrobiales bacterium]
MTGALARIGERDGDLHAVVALSPDAVSVARERDAELRAGNRRGPLHGIPISVKDVIHVAGLPTRAGSDAYSVMADHEGTGVARLRAAGAVIVAKVSTHEFALGVTSPQTRNPWDPTRIPGGSSGGSAVSVATGMALASLGTDTRASIRVPAALSGVVGFKPTYGRTPTDGIVPLAWTMDHLATMAMSVDDAAIMLDALLDDGSALAGARLDRPAVVGIARCGFDGAEPGVAGCARAAVAALGRRGLPLVNVSLPSAGDLELANAAGLVISRSEAAAFHRSLDADLSLYWEEVAQQLELGAEVAAVDYLDAQRARGLLATRLLEVFEECDVLAMPTVPVVAPLAEDFASYLMVLARNAIPWSLVGFPALSVPCGFSEGLPVGLQLVAPPGREDLLVAVGREVEEAVAWPREVADLAGSFAQAGSGDPQVVPSA